MRSPLTRLSERHREDLERVLAALEEETADYEDAYAELER
jgi:hypothetical protein